ncbi:MAG: CoA transferase [Dehalococcoidia bacterium]|jgi:benzylsuccinate CoA-transferase BbsF subunit
MQILEGIRIADFTRYAAGPQITLTLAFMGAEVIRIESNAELDHFRRPESAVSYGSTRAANDSFNTLNLNKLSVTLNLKTAGGVELARKLVAKSDVVVDNFRPGVMDRLGLGYDSLKKIKPDIIMLSASSHGAVGPEKQYSAYAVTFGPIGGVSHLTGYEGGNPAVTRSSADLRPGTAAAFAILAALNYRETSGEGQFIDFSAREAISCEIGEAIMDYTMNGHVRTRHGNRDDILAPNNCYRCKGDDKWISIAIANDDEWKSLVAAMGNPAWAKDAKFADQFHRWHNQDEIDVHIAEWALNYTDYELMNLLQKSGVAAIPAFDSEELFTDPHCRDRNVFVPTETATEGLLYAVAPPWKFSETPAQVTKAAPELGQDNSYVLRKLLGLSQKEIDKLTADKVLY